MQKKEKAEEHSLKNKMMQEEEKEKGLYEAKIKVLLDSVSK